MYRDLSQLNEEEFRKKQGVFCGEEMTLVYPITTNPFWTKLNSIYRSSIWDKNGKLISPGFKKFMNFGEKPEQFPLPSNYKDASFISKIDGSCLIVSKYNDQVVARTRETFNFENLDNGWELQIVKDKYPYAFDNDYLDNGHTLIFEIVSDVNKIVLSYEDCPDLLFIGMINNEDYSYAKQNTLDLVAKEIGVKRPTRIDFSNFNGIHDFIKFVEDEKGIEGYCLYFNNDQDILKIKSAHYLKLHRMKTEVASIKNIIDLYISYGYPNYNDFFEHVSNDFDYEVAEHCRGDLSLVCDAYKELLKIKGGMISFLERNKYLSRKDLSKEIFSSYGKTTRASCVFNILDTGDIYDRHKKTLMLQKLKNKI